MLDLSDRRRKSCSKINLGGHPPEGIPRSLNLRTRNPDPATWEGIPGINLGGDPGKSTWEGIQVYLPSWLTSLTAPVSALVVMAA